jgi:mannosyltransferase
MLPEKRYRIAVVALTAIALVLRVVRLDHEMWLDEVTSASIALLPRAEFIEVITHGEINMVLYYVFLRYWILLGDSSVILRLPSALFSAATVPLVAAAANRLFGPRVALLSATLVTLNRFHIFWGEEVRTYALQGLLLAASLYFLIEWQVRKSTLHRTLYVVAAVLSVYAQLLSVLALAVHAAAALLVRRHGASHVVAVFGVIALGIAPIVPFMDSGGAHVWIPAVTPQIVKQALYDVSGGRVAFLLTSVCVAGGLAAWLGNPSATEAPRWRVGLLIGCTVFPIVALILLSLIRPYFVARYLNIIIAPMVILTGLVVEIRWRVLRVIMIGALLLAHAKALFSYYRETLTPIYHPAASYVTAELQRGDALVFTPKLLRLVFEWYADRVSPGAVQSHAVWPAAFGLRRPSHTVIYIEPELDRERLAGHSRVWVIGHQRDKIEPALADFVDEKQQRFRHLQVVLLRRATPAELQKPRAPAAPTP